MKFTHTSPVFVIAVFMIAVSACTTIRADVFLIKKTTPQEKAELLYREGLTQYNEDLKANNNFKAIPKIRRYFSDALKINPMHPKAQIYINEIDSYKKDRFTATMKTAQALQKKEKRTESQKYEMIYAVKQASDLKALDIELFKLRNATKKDRSDVIQTRVAAITALEPKILAEKNQTTLTKYLKESNHILGELENVDPGNATGIKIGKNIDTFVTTLAQKDIDGAREKLTAKKYADAEISILKAEKNLFAMTSLPNQQIQTLKYQIYYTWATDLLSAKKYPAASTKTAQAINVNRTAEAVALQTKINKVSSIRDYDADIGDIIESVDSYLGRGDLSGAQNVILTNLPKLQVQANKNRLSAKNADVTAQKKLVYQEGINRYNEEDYESSLQKFRAVVKVDPEYEQAQAYLDRSNTKIRALSGID